ncbi:IclR family transcriptional regulator [Salinarimonas soli]|uniref:IclR family transcriptional regulator n=1 Tax=Salinarimonas soli TaxID=1638099 RepID=A0A5B2V877_9HYPH|nr:IclR family transcriptional regulator [Salinarimonas soli]KAA2235171.1 IclR family transcriptional regulator [Salinarimonas soli]
MEQRRIPPVEAAIDGTGTQSIGRAVALLRLVAGSRAGGAALSDLVERSRLSKPTCRRILVALIDAGLMEQDPVSRRYFLGPEAHVLGTLAAERFGLHRLAHEGVVRLAEETGDAAFFQIRRDWSAVCLQREDGDYPLRSHVLAPGDRHPLGAGAGGLAILAALEDGDVEAALTANEAWLARSYAVLTPPLLRDLVHESRAQGYAMNRGLLFPGSWGMGMPVRDARGRAVACLSLACVESRLQPNRQPVLARALAREVRDLERRMAESGAAPVSRPRRAAGGSR